MDDLSQSYRILELEGPVSKDEIKRAYRDMVKVWHPDRFGEDEMLQRLAEKKLKEINGAYEILMANLFADGADDPGATVPPPTSDEKPPAITSKRRVIWSLLIVVLALVGAIWGGVWKNARSQERLRQIPPTVTESTPQKSDQSHSPHRHTATIASNAIPDAPDQHETKAPAIVPVISPAPPTSPDPIQKIQAPTAPGSILADYIYTVADDFVVDVFHDGKRLTDNQRKLLNDTYGATAEKIEVTVREGDWLVFNVVKNRFRWDGQSCFVVAGMRQNGAIGFVSEFQSGRWSCCDDPADATRFIAESAYLTSNRVRPISRLWGPGVEQIKGLAKNWPGQPIWGTNSCTWIKFRAPRAKSANELIKSSSAGASAASPKL